MNGYKSIYPNIKIVAISGGGKLDGSNYLSVAKSLGADLTFQKPFDNEEIVQAVINM